MRLFEAFEAAGYESDRAVSKRSSTTKGAGSTAGTRESVIGTYPRQSAHHRPHRLRQNLDCLRAGQQDSRDGFTVLYHRFLRLFGGRGHAYGDGRYPNLMRKLARTDVLVLDDWGLNKLTAPPHRHLLDVPDDRHKRHSTLVTSRLPVEPTHTDAILDRLVHNAYRIVLKGESMRKLTAKGGGPLTAKS